MKMKQLIVCAFVLCAVCLGSVGYSDAACTAVGRISAVYQTPTVCSVWITPNEVALPSYYYLFTTTDPELMARLGSAQAGNLRVRLFGNAASCPTSGTVRTGGVLTTLYVYSY